MIKCWKLLRMKLLVVDEWRLKSMLFSQFDMYIIHWSYHTFGKKCPTFSNSEANSSNSDGFAHWIMWCKLAIRASIIASIHFRNVSSDTLNSCDHVRKQLTNAKKIIIKWLIYYFVWFLSKHKSWQLFCACKHVLYPAE